MAADDDKSKGLDDKYKNYGLPSQFPQAVKYPVGMHGAIMWWVDHLKHKPAGRALDYTSKMAGRPGAILHAHDVWIDAAKKIVWAQSEINEPVPNMAGWWAGPGFTAFDKWREQVDKASEKNQTALINVGGHLLRAYEGIITVYNDAVRKMSETASHIMNLRGSFLTGIPIIKVAEFGDKVMEELDKFVKESKEHEIAQRNIIAEYITIQKSMCDAIVPMAKVGDFPDAAGMKGKWEFQR